MNLPEKMQLDEMIEEAARSTLWWATQLRDAINVIVAQNETHPAGVVSINHWLAEMMQEGERGLMSRVVELAQRCQDKIQTEAFWQQESLEGARSWKPREPE